MKTIPTSYIFDASAQTITCSDFTALEKIAIITNLVTWDIIYQFNNPAKLWSLVWTTLTLVFDTTTMSDTDEIQIIVEKDINPATFEWQEVTALLRGIFSLLQLPRNHDQANNADRVNVINTIAATVTTITTLTNLQQLNWVQAHQMSVASELTAWYSTCRTTII